MGTTAFNFPKEEVAKQIETMFPLRQDVKTAFMLLLDYTRRFFPNIPYRTLLTTAKEVDEVHGEIIETQKRWSDIFKVRAFVVPTLVTQPLTRFGLEEDRKADLLMTVVDMQEAGLATVDPATYETTIETSGIGDHFFYHQREYEIISFVPVARWGNTDIVIYYTAHGEIYRGHSIEAFVDG